MRYAAGDLIRETMLRAGRAPRGSVRLAAVYLAAWAALASAAPEVQTPTAAPAADPFAAVLHPSEEATTLIARAEEGLDRKDWKLVADCLQRIIDLPGDQVLTSGDRKYASARVHALRRLAELPPEGLRTYRLVQDGQASGLFDRAVADHDEALLRSIVDHSLLTSVGDEEAATLADWMIDEGRFTEAMNVLRQVKDLCRDSDLPAWVVPMRMAVCLAGAGRGPQAEALLNGARTAFENAGGGPSFDAVRKALQQLAGRQDARGESGWPMVYGRPTRDGVMPLVEPSFLDHLPWNVELIAGDSRFSAGAITEYAKKRELLPTATLVADGHRVVVKTGDQLIGLDADTFDVAWSTKDRRHDASMQDLEDEANPPTVWTVVNGQPAEDRLGGDPLMRRLYDDYVGSQVTLTGGLVLTVEWPDDPPDTVAMRRRGTPMRAFTGAGPAATDANFVVAFSADTGQRVWTSDTASGPNGLGPVQFLAAPIAVDGGLLAPCRLNDDLYVVLLDPQTGAILRHAYLCGTGGGPFDALYPCTPCVADNAAYIPTNRGVLIALDIASWSIRWAVRYREPAANQAAGMAWLPTPVMAVSDVVLLAPSDVDKLIAIDRFSGDVRWEADRGDAVFVLAADNTTVWVVGTEARAINLETGKDRWRQPCGQPTGRGVLAGDRLYVPTADGLQILHADSGEPIVGEPGASEITTGNLLAWEGSLYVASAFEARKYPDMERGYAKAVADHAAQPADVALAMRLAWLEYLKGEPAKALAVLNGVPESAQASDPHRQERYLHLKLLVMLDAAALPETDGDAALRLLEDARKLAPTAEDAIAARLALGAHYRSRQANGKLQACMEFVSLAVESTGDEMLSEEAGGYLRRAGMAADRKLGDMLGTLTSAEREALDRHVRELLDRAVAASDWAKVDRLAELTAMPELVGQADLALSGAEATNLEFERAEARLRRILHACRTPDMLAAATARLASIYLLPEELHQPASALPLLERLERDFADVRLPAGVLIADFDSGRGTVSAAPEAQVPAMQLAAQLRQRIDPAVLARHEATLKPIELGPARIRERITSYDTGRPIMLEGEPIEPLADQFLILDSERTIEARQRSTSRLLWPAELRLLQEFSIESQTLIDQAARVSRGHWAGSPARAGAEGQILVINTRYGLHAVGMCTGRRLWSRRFDPPTDSHGRSEAGSDACVRVYGGYVCSVDAYGRLDVARVEAGDHVLWSRRMPQRRWQHVRAEGEFVIAVDDGLSQVDVFGLADGRYVGQCQFTQEVDDDRRINLVMFDDVICGPASPREAAAFELNTPGIERWRVAMPADLVQLFQPAPDVLTAADQAGRIQLIDVKNGRRRLNTRVPVCPAGVLTGKIEGETLYVAGLEQAGKTRATGREPRRYAIAALRLPDGEVMWSHAGIGEQTSLTPALFAAAANVIPLVESKTTGEQARVNPNSTFPLRGVVQKLELRLLDKKTGHLVGSEASVELPNMRGEPQFLSVDVWPGCVSVFAGAVHMQFMTPAAKEAAADPTLERP